METNTPKRAFAFAIQAGLASDENICLRILQDRNLTTHTYNDALSKAIYAAVKQDYLHVLRAIIEAVAAQAHS